jgi:hypothetical protein
MMDNKKCIKYSKNRRKITEFFSQHKIIYGSPLGLGLGGAPRLGRSVRPLRPAVGRRSRAGGRGLSSSGRRGLLAGTLNVLDFF